MRGEQSFVSLSAIVRWKQSELLVKTLQVVTSGEIQRGSLHNSSSFFATSLVLLFTEPFSGHHFLNPKATIFVFWTKVLKQ